MRRSFAACVLVLVLTSCTSSSPSIDRDGSDVVDGAGSVPATAPPDRYSITYRVERVVDGEVTTSDAVLTVDRPFRSRLEVHEGDSTWVRVGDLTYLGDGDQVFTAAPQAAPDDVRGDLLRIDDGGTVRRVAGEPCVVQRFGASLFSGEVVDGDSVEACIDGHGLVLEEVSTEDGKIVERWLATAVDLRPRIDDDEFVLAGVEPVAASNGGGSAQRVNPTTWPPGTFWELDGVPEGFRHIERYAVVPPQDARTDDPKTRARVIAAISDVFVRGQDVLIIEQGGTLGQVPPFGTRDGSETVDAGRLAANAELFRTPTGCELRALLPPGHYVKVLGTLPTDEVVAIARQLRSVEGTGLRYLEPSAG